jgi:hypothetical protein
MIKLNAYQLKWIAIIGMVLSHAVYALREILPLWLMIPMMASGGLTYPIMGYFVVEGYKHTSNLKKYLLRLFVFGLIATPFYVLTFRSFQPNIMFSIMLGIFTFILYDKIKTKFVFWLIFPLILLISMFFDWWAFGTIMLMMYYVMRNETARRIVPAIVFGTLVLPLIFFGIINLTALEAMSGMEAQIQAFHNTWGNMDILISSSTVIVGCICAAILLKNFNGERGKRAKWLFYIAYPLHFAILGGIALALGFVDLSVFGF